jgi:hypothetical protein
LQSQKFDAPESAAAVSAFDDAFARLARDQVDGAGAVEDFAAQSRFEDRRIRRQTANMIGVEFEAVIA